MKKSLLTATLAFASVNLTSFMYAQMKTVTSEAEFNELMKSDAPVVIKFSTEQCGQCKRIESDVDAVANDPQFEGKVSFVHVDLGKDELMGIGEKHGVVGVPAFFYIKGGKKVHEDVGAGDDYKIYLTNTVKQQFNLDGTSQSTSEGTVAEAELTPGTGRNLEEEVAANTAQTAEQKKTVVEEKKTVVEQQTSVPTTTPQEEGILEKLKGFVVMIFTKIKDLLMGIVNWVKSLFGK